MKQPFKPGDKKIYTRVVREEDAATFESGNVHPVYSTFALSRDAEWACRLFVLEMTEGNEEGIGTLITVEHHSPALIGQKVDFTAILASVKGNEIICGYKARVGKRLIASGRQKQKIIKKKKIATILKKLQRG
jgi:predicted thioesterase